MKIQLQSDLHLEFAEFEANYAAADVLVLAGDIHVGTKGVEWAVSLGLDIPVIYVAGNHENYNQAYPTLQTELRAAAAGSNVHFLENESLELDGVAFHGATLWTDFKLYGKEWTGKAMAQYAMPDYKVIWYDPRASYLTPDITQQIHTDSLNWLAQSLESSKATSNVVISHHGPSLKSSAECYSNDEMTAAFLSNLEGFIDRWQPDYWLHGHCHNLSDYMIGGCRVICNPRGYPKEKGTAFNDQLIIETA